MLETILSFFQSDFIYRLILIINIGALIIIGRELTNIKELIEKHIIGENVDKREGKTKN